MPIYKFLILISFLILNFKVQAQNINPGQDEVFRESEVARIIISMTDEDRDFLLANENIWSDTYLPAQLRFQNSELDIQIENDVGIRLRGNTSRGAPKRSFKIKFKEFEGEKFFDHKKFNLKAEVNDPSLAREFLTMQTFRKANVPAARTHHAEVYLNDQYMGLYLNVEQIDDEFVQSRFDNDEGNLYKCSYGANLLDDGQIFNNDVYELETNKTENDRSILNNFVEVLNNTPDDEFEAALEAVFNVNTFIDYLAVEALTGHWDGYSVLMNNYYLYENPINGKIEFIAYDTDNTFGIDWLGDDWGSRDVLNWVSNSGQRPLTTRVLSRKKYLAKYKLKLREMLDRDFSELYFFPEMERIRSMISGSVETDDFYGQTFGFTFQSFQDSYSKETGGHVEYGLKNYVTERISFAEDQIGDVITSLENELNENTIFPNPNDGQRFIFQSQKVQEELQLVDVMGRNINFDLFRNSDKNYEISTSLKSGIYFLITSEDRNKFIVR